MKLRAAKSRTWITLILLFGIGGMTANALKLGIALDNPDMGLALEVFEEPGRLSYLRALLFLKAGAVADKPIGYWDIEDPPLVACVDSGNYELARALIDRSSPVTLQRAINKACTADAEGRSAVLRVLAGARRVDTDTLCSSIEEIKREPSVLR